MATPLGSWDQDGENEIFLPCKHVSKSLPKQDMQMFLNLSSYTLRKVSKTSQQSYSRILWQNIAATLQQDSAVAEFCGRMQQCYSRTVPQQNSVAKCGNVTAGQCRSRILWKNAATLQLDSAVEEFCDRMQQLYSRTDNIVAEFFGRMQQRYGRTVQQQKSVPEHDNIKTKQYHEQSAMAEYCSKMLYNRNILRTLQYHRVLQPKKKIS